MQYPRTKSYIAIENLDQADALLFGRVSYEMMEAAFRPPAGTGGRPEWMELFARTIDAAKKYVVSSTLHRVDWNAELVRGDLEKAVQQLKRESGSSSRNEGSTRRQNRSSRFSRQYFSVRCRRKRVVSAVT